MRLPRAAGVLLHPTSLPGPYGSGDLGASARHFVDWLLVGGQRLWQMLPLGDIGPGNSPYMSPSAFAGNVLLVDLEELRARGWLTDADLADPAGASLARIDFAQVTPWRMERLSRAARRFAEQGDAAARAEFDAFRASHAAWLTDYALFRALDEHFDGRPWCDWDAPLARRDPAALAAARLSLTERIAFWEFCQWCFVRQWQALRAYANERGVRIVGDLPIFVAYQSAETWARPELFELDEQGRQTVVAGVPPDLSARPGQHWGQSALSLAGPCGRRLCLVDRAGAPHLRAGRRRPHRPLPRLRRRIGRSPAARRPPSTAAGPRGPARPCSTPSVARWASCPSSRKTSA